MDSRLDLLIVNWLLFRYLRAQPAAVGQPAACRRRNTFAVNKFTASKDFAIGHLLAMTQFTYAVQLFGTMLWLKLPTWLVS